MQMAGSREYGELISAYIDNEVSAEERAQVERITQDDPLCAHELHSMIALKGRLRVAFRRAPVPHELWQGYMRRVGPTPDLAQPAPKGTKARGFWSLPRLVPAVGMLAVLVVFAFVYAGRPPGGLTCEQAQEMVPEYAGGALDMESAFHLSAHFADCPVCQERYLAFAREHYDPGEISVWPAADPPLAPGSVYVPVAPVGWVPEGPGD